MTKNRAKTYNTLSASYDAGRKAFPKKVILLVHSLIGKRPSRILDLGCGTGIATRQMMRRGITIVGCDPSRPMLAKAETHPPTGISYVFGHAEKLPFPDQSFNAVTAFSAFHWFTNTGAVQEIKRVLQPNGVFFIVNKKEKSTVKHDFKKMLAAFTKKKLPEIQKQYTPAALLKKNRFRDVREKIFSVREKYTKEETLTFLQSSSFWNLVPKRKAAQFRAVLKKYLRTTYGLHPIIRQMEIVVVWGLK